MLKKKSELYKTDAQYNEPAELTDKELNEVTGGVFIMSESAETMVTPLPSHMSGTVKADFLTPQGGRKSRVSFFDLVFRRGHGQQNKGGKSDDNTSTLI